MLGGFLDISLTPAEVQAWFLSFSFAERLVMGALLVLLVGLIAGWIVRRYWDQATLEARDATLEASDRNVKHWRDLLEHYQTEAQAAHTAPILAPALSAQAADTAPVSAPAPSAPLPSLADFHSVGPPEPRAPVGSEPPSSGRSAEQILQFVNDVKDLARKCPVKIVSTDEWLPFSQMLVEAFRVAKYEVLVNERDSTWIFPAAKKHGRVTVRSRPGNATSLLVHLGLIDLVRCDSQAFPDTDAYNFIQIEIGGSP